MKLFPALWTKASRAFSIHFQNMQTAQWTPRRYGAFAKEAYQFNVVGYSAINRIAWAVSSIEWEAWKDDEQLFGHPLLDLLKRPNPMQSGPDWWRTRISYLLLSGNMFDERVLDSAGLPKELWPLRPDRMTILKSTTGMPSGFDYKVSQNTIHFDADPITGDSPILHTKLFHPFDDWYGMSPIEAAAYSVDQHNQSMNWVQSLLQNSARPSGALIVDKDTNLSDDEYKRLKLEVEKKYAGSENAGRPMLLEGGLDWKAMGLSPMDMEILKTKESAARDISLAFGVPPLLLNIPGDNTFANYREARLGFYEDTILPFVKYVVSEFNQWLAPFYEGVEIRPNKDKIEAIADKRTKMWEMADNSLDITLNESRAIKGLDPLPAPMGDMLMAEVRSMALRQEEPNGANSADVNEEVIKELAFGTRR